jgi:hypothetical protein
MTLSKMKNNGYLGQIANELRQLLSKILLYQLIYRGSLILCELFAPFLVTAKYFNILPLHERYIAFSHEV